MNDRPSVPSVVASYLLYFVTIRTGYYPWVFERRVVLEALYNRIWDKSKVLVGKRVRGIVYEDDRASVICDDGSKHVGDVIVGGDGVHSVILKEMWRICDLQEPGRITDKDKKCWLSYVLNYQCSS